MPDVLGYLRFIFSYGIHIVASAPKPSITVFELQIRDLFIDPQTSLAFQETHKARDCKLRRDLQQHMNKVRSTLSFDNLPPPSIHIICAEFLLKLFSSHRKRLAADILERTQCDIYNSTLYEISF